MPLNKKQQQQYKAKAHKLKPIVMIGNKGLSENVKKEIAIGLRDHELIKISIQGVDRVAKKELFAEICKATQAEPIQLIGNIGVLYKKRIAE